MAWLRMELTEAEQKIVQAERDSHPSACVRRRLLVIWSLHCGLTREKAARVAGVAISTVNTLDRQTGCQSVSHRSARNAANVGTRCHFRPMRLRNVRT